MHTSEMILVHIPKAIKNDKTMMPKMERAEIEKKVIMYAEGIMESFCEQGKIDYYSFYDESEDIDYANPIVFADQDWDTFISYLEDCDRGQKGQAQELIEDLMEDIGTTDVSQILNDLLLSHDRSASKSQVDEKTWKYDYLNKDAWTLKTISSFIHGDFMFESGFYDSYRRTALVPFYNKLKENKEDWALVVFDCHF